MARRRCLDCPAIGDWQRTRGRCPQHQPTNAERGYDAAHVRERARWQRILDSGRVVMCTSYLCVSPDAPVDPTNWHLGHTSDRTTWTGPQHPGCNLIEAGQAS